MKNPCIRVLATGGTIAGKAGSATRHDYRPGQIGIDDLLSEAESLGMAVTLSGVQIANIGSEDIGPAVWSPLHAATVAAVADPAVDGVIITHGTDTVEETALLLDLTLPTAKPVVMVGAMRPADAVGSDGLRNLANAVRVASDPGAAGRGVLVVMGDRVFAARDVRKVRTRGTDAFRGFPRESIGLVTPSALDWFGAPWRMGEAARFVWPDQWPEVPVLPIWAGIEPDYVTRLTGPDTRGVVVAGVGEGNMPEPVRQVLRELAVRGVAVVRASRIDEGLVDREPEDDANGFLAARALNPPKARILLQLMLASGVSVRAAMQAEFDRR
ncbi:MAG: asparaginase [Tsuneonella suprasediminis]|uniref:Asparaginase n=1 Tax=Tsuneonella suprasediminis TaxID=2306996 RepID=A0A419QYV2_9SPHN|nr:asparaginase [Tsuneonella suprasediminis]RJX66006.1 asparaginase [Tsuneonella suprasediminis]UBS32649.1 asparaginase [Altererythrobacter sp. N1]